MLPPERLRLILITDRELAAPSDLEQVIAAALEAGAPAVQLRDKNAPAADLLETARRMRKLTALRGALLFVNDRVDVALAAGADGVHLGPTDLPVSDVRRHVPGGFLIGYSTDDPEEARRAEADGASYLGCGTVWPTRTKPDAGRAIGPEGLAAVARAVSIPVVGIGGVTVSRSRELRGTGAAGVAVVRAIMSSPDPGATTRSFLDAWRE